MKENADKKSRHFSMGSKCFRSGQLGCMEEPASSRVLLCRVSAVSCVRILMYAQGSEGLWLNAIASLLCHDSGMLSKTLIFHSNRFVDGSLVIPNMVSKS